LPAERTGEQFATPAGADLACGLLQSAADDEVFEIDLW